MATKSFTWSYSAYKLYLECPLRYKLKHIERLPEPRAAHLDRGTTIHDALDRAGVQGQTPEPFIKESSGLLKIVTGLRNKPNLEGERRWPFDRNFAPCEDAKRWGVAKLDYFYTVGKTSAVVGDWKTGKIYPDNVEQTNFYALLAFRRFPHLKTIETQLVYVDQREKIETKYRAEQIEPVAEQITRVVNLMETDKLFRAKPNRYCKWCPWNKAKGGPCKAA